MNDLSNAETTLLGFIFLTFIVLFIFFLIYTIKCILDAKDKERELKEKELENNRNALSESAKEIPDDENKSTIINGIDISTLTKEQLLTILIAALEYEREHSHVNRNEMFNDINDDTIDEISLAAAGIEPFATIYGFSHD